MPKVNHSFTLDVKRGFIAAECSTADHQAMLDSPELARRIRLAFEQSPRGTKAAVARECDIQPQAITGWERKGAIDKAYLPILARLTGRRVDYFLDVTVSDEESLDSLRPAVSPVAETATGANYVRVEQLDGEADMGDGRVNDDYPEVIRSVDYTREYIRGLVGFVPPPGRLVLITGRGDSMLPTIQPGESLLVDTGINCFDGDGIYLVNLGSGQQFKRLVDHGGEEGVYVHSDNESIRAYAPRRLHPDAIIGGKVYLRNRIDRFN